MIKIKALGVPSVVALLFLTACSGSGTKDSVQTSGTGQQQAAGGVQQQVADGGQQAPVMQPLQADQPPQKPPKGMFSKGQPVPGGNPGTTALPNAQPFTLGDFEYQFIGRTSKDFVGLKENPAMHPTPGNVFFVVRYQVIDHGQPAVVPNAAAVHLMSTDKQVVDIDQAATNANVQSGAATGMPNQLSLNTEEPQIQTLVFQMPSATDFGQYALLVTDPKDPTHLFQLVQISN